MNKLQIYKTIGYILLIITGYIIGQYPFINSFDFWVIHHIQPSIEVYDKCISVTLFIFSLALLFSLWHNFWLMVIMIFISWGMLGNLIDEMNNRATILTISEKISLLLALTTTAILIWTRHRKSITK